MPAPALIEAAREINALPKLVRCGGYQANS